MHDKMKFIAESPLGYTVTCSKNTWERHIVLGHSMMIGNEQTVVDAIERPVAIYRSGSHENRHIYFGTTENASYAKKIPYTKAVVERIDNSFLVTAFPTKKVDGNINGGELLYVDRKPRC